MNRNTNQKNLHKSDAWVTNHFFCEFIVKKNLDFGGERGIRTLGSIATTHAFQAC